MKFLESYDTNKQNVITIMDTENIIEKKNNTRKACYISLSKNNKLRNTTGEQHNRKLIGLCFVVQEMPIFFW